MNMTVEEIAGKTKLFESNIRAMNSEMQRYNFELSYFYIFPNSNKKIRKSQ